MISSFIWVDMGAYKDAPFLFHNSLLKLQVKKMKSNFPDRRRLLTEMYSFVRTSCSLEILSDLKLNSLSLRINNLIFSWSIYDLIITLPGISYTQDQSFIMQSALFEF